MLRKGLLPLALTLAAGCAARPAARRAPVSASASKPLSAESRKQVDRDYYEAVDAYMKADYARSRALIKTILAAEPGNAEALSLRRRVSAVEKASAPE